MSQPSLEMKCIFILFFFLSTFSNSHAYFRCPDGKNITNQLLFDGNNDCFAGEDEYPWGLLSCGTSRTRIATQYVCDGGRDCPDDSDEEDCAPNGNFTAPAVFKVTNNTKNLKHLPAYILRGKIPENGKKFTISLLTVTNGVETVTPNDLLLESSSVESPMRMFVDFGKNETFMNSIVKKKFGISKNIIAFSGGKVPRQFEMFKKGANFVMRIEPYVSMMRFDVAVASHEDTNFTYEVDLSKEEEFNELTSLAVPNYIQIEGDIVLFEEPKLITKKTYF